MSIVEERHAVQPGRGTDQDHAHGHKTGFIRHYPEVYIVVVPAMGVAAEILATFIRKPVFGYKVMAGCWVSIAALSLIVWGHHMFVSGCSAAYSH